MPELPKCPQCGTLLPTGALAGLCPACLLKAGAAADTLTDAKQPAFNPPTIAEIAALFPALEILELIGKGGMGAVYKARQKQLDRIVALKILPPGIGDDPAFAERFAREAKALAKLNHPGIVTLYEFGSSRREEAQTEKAEGGNSKAETSRNLVTSAAAGNLYFFLMEYVDGVNLRQLLHAGRVSAREALAIVPQICDALQFAHDQGIVHRDIKPENILLDRRGRVKVADFGLAKIISSDAPLTPSLYTSDGERVAKPGEGSPILTDAGRVMGTPQYMSPEQIQAPGEVDHRADIYALGVVFYQMLTGELPGKRLEAPSKKVQIDVRLDEVVLRALEKNPALRYQQVSEVKTMVDTIVATPGSSRGNEAQTEKAEIENRKLELAPRFSPTAILGACLCLIHAVLLPLVHYRGGDDFGPPRSSAPVWTWLVYYSEWVFFGCSLLAMTYLGWKAVAEIRRSAGKLHGLWLAQFDGLLLPLLAILVACRFATSILVLTFCRFWTSAVGRPVDLSGIHIETLGLLIGGLINVLIVWMVWRAVNKDSATVPPFESSGSRREEAQTESGRGSQSLVTSAATNQNSRFSNPARWALVLLLAGTLGAVLLWGVLGAKEVIFLSSLALLASLGLGVMSWRTPPGKFAVITSGVGLMLVMALILNLPTSPHRPRSKHGMTTMYTPLKGNLLAAVHAETEGADFQLGMPIDVTLPLLNLSQVSVTVNPQEQPPTARLTLEDSAGRRVELAGTDQAVLQLKTTRLLTYHDGVDGYALRLLLLSKDAKNAVPNGQFDAIARVEPGQYKLQYYLQLPVVGNASEGSLNQYHTTPLTIEVKGASANAGAKPTKQSLSFGPVVERTLFSRQQQLGMQGLNLDSGEVIAIEPKDMPRKEAAQKWLVDHGIDLVIANPGDDWEWSGAYLALTPLPENQWDQVTPEELIRALKNDGTKNREGLQVLTFPPPGDEWATFVFRAGVTGVSGILQITSLTENPRGLKLRYKLVQPE